MTKNPPQAYLKPMLKKLRIDVLAYRSYHGFIAKFTYLRNIYRKSFKKTAPILLYHRIDSVSNDPIKLCVSPKSFEEHLQFLKRNYDVIPLSELSRRVIEGTLKGNEAAVTFDDGYEDNLMNALPILEKYTVPATIFVTTGMLGKKANFGWDKKYLGTDRATFLNPEEIKILSNHKLIEIGAHTDTHPRLTRLSEIEQKDEVSRSKKILEEITDKKILALAYPFGGINDYNRTLKKIVSKSDFQFAYTNTGLFAVTSEDPFSIPRINIRESSVTELASKLHTFSIFGSKC